jgi:sialidase-1
MVGTRLCRRTLLMASAFGSRALAQEAQVEPRELFRAGEGGYALYRIPGIAATGTGALLAYCEARKNERGDWGTIDVLLRRSVDGGRTWESPRRIADPPPVPKNPVAVRQNLAREGEVTVNNPVAIADRSPGVVHFLYCVEYARCFYMRSEDDGRTFSRAVDITSAFEAFRPEYDWKVLATGPGHGIRLRGGRLLVPVWLSTGTGGHAHRPSCVSVIYSDDGGKRWQRGEIVAADPRPPNPSETAAVELSDGSVMLNIRHEGPDRRRAVSVSRNGATGWSPARFDPQLPDPVCMGSLVRLSGPPRSRILFSNLNRGEDRQRKNLTVRLSYDECRTWAHSRTLEPGASGYSDLAVLADESIFCFYERGGAGDTPSRTRSLTLARFDLDWLTRGADPF